MVATDKDKSRKSARRLAREFALRGVYQWLLADNEAVAIESHLRDDEEFARADAALFQRLFYGAIESAAQLRERISPHLSRGVDQLSPVEHAVLLLATLELCEHIETPYRVVINEAIELAKIYGGADGHKFVNGVLDKLAPELRAAEIQAQQQQ